MPPIGYRNNKGTRAIEIHPEKSAIAQHVFEMYASGRYSLLASRRNCDTCEGTCISKTNLHKMLTNPFYIGQFEWGGHTYQGTHPPFISPDLYAQVQAVLARSQQAEIQQARHRISRPADVRT